MLQHRVRSGRVLGHGHRLEVGRGLQQRPAVPDVWEDLLHLPIVEALPASLIAQDVLCLLRSGHAPEQRDGELELLHAPLPVA
eukprot:5403934-Pyramimonas_sp.AAC.1